MGHNFKNYQIFIYSLNKCAIQRLTDIFLLFGIHFLTNKSKIAFVCHEQIKNFLIEIRTHDHYCDRPV